MEACKNLSQAIDSGRGSIEKLKELSTSPSSMAMILQVTNK
jgi:hypothetical protein